MLNIEGKKRITFEFEKMNGTNVCVLGGFVMCTPGEDNGTLLSIFCQDSFWLED